MNRSLLLVIACAALAPLPAVAQTPPTPTPAPAPVATPPAVVQSPPPPVGSAGTTGSTQPSAGTGQAPPPTGAEPTASEPFENIMDEIDEQDRLDWERRKAARDARVKAKIEDDFNVRYHQEVMDYAIRVNCDRLAFQHAKSRLLEANWELIGRFPNDPALRAEQRRIEETQFPEPCPPETRTALAPIELDEDSTTLLALHNQARAEAGAPPLAWDPALAAGARAYAVQLTSAGRLVHSSRVGRKDIRENLLQSLPGRSPEQMIGVWTAEKRHFKPGIFPDVSTTGNWYDIGHYTQMIWETNTRVGCGAHGDARFTWLVCHYSPGGNKDGKPIGMPPPTP